MSSIDYYENPSEWGNYQYSTLNEIINNYMMSRVVGDPTSMIPRYQVLFQAKRIFRELYYDVVREIKAVEMELSPLLNITVPPDFISYVRISWLDDLGYLHPMAIDRSLSIAQDYLQDDEYNLLFDDEGCVLKGDGLSNQVNFVQEGSEHKRNRCYSFCKPFTPNKDLSKSFPNGRYNYDREKGIIQFSADAFSRKVVIEYISDGLYTGCEGREESQIRIHKFAEDAVYHGIYYYLIKQNINVPMNEKVRARKEFYNSRRIAKRRVNSIKVAEIMQIFKGASKWIKS